MEIPSQSRQELHSPHGFISNLSNYEKLILSKKTKQNKTLKLLNDLRYDLCFKCLVVVGVISVLSTNIEQNRTKALESVIHQMFPQRFSK